MSPEQTRGSPTRQIWAIWEWLSESEDLCFLKAREAFMIGCEERGELSMLKTSFLLPALMFWLTQGYPSRE